MKKSIILIVAALMLSVAGTGKENKTEKGTVKNASLSFTGTVTDEKTGELLTGVEIKIEGTDIKTYTDFDGKFSIQNVKPGPHHLVASYVSYNKTRTTELNLNEKDHLDIRLQSAK